MKPRYMIMSTIDISKQMPNIIFTREIEPGTRLIADEFSFTIVLNEQFNPKVCNNYKFRFHTPSTLVNSTEHG